MPAYKDKNGTWFAKFQYRENGKSKTKLKRGFEKKRDALDYERKFLESYSSSADMTFATLTEKFLKAKEREVKHGTLLCYESFIHADFLSALRDKKISEITPSDILDVRSSMSELEPSTVNLYMSRLNRVFEFACDIYGLKKNPCKSISRVASYRKEKVYLTIDEVERLKAIPTVTEEMKVLTDILFWTGMRISEALALTVDDFHGTYLVINKHKVRGKSGVVSAPGTKNGRGRNVQIFDSLSKEIAEYIEKLYDHTGSTELFPLRYRAYFRRYQRLFNEIGSKATIHSFRHSHVALLIHRGYSPKLIADRIGDTIQTMLDVYAHVYPEDTSLLMNDLENVSNLYHEPK